MLLIYYISRPEVRYIGMPVKLFLFTFGENVSNDFFSHFRYCVYEKIFLLRLKR